MSLETVETSRGTWNAPSAAERRAILRRSHTIAVVGASADPAKASNFVLSYLRSGSADFELWPVTPKGGEVLGLTAYTSVSELPGTPDVVCAFRPPAALPGVAEDAVAVGAKVFWAQLGLHSDEAVAVAHGAGLDTVTNRCLKIEHARFAGGLHLAGFDTGVISSKRTRG
jgi:predicted CoA-binding protein